MSAERLRFREASPVILSFGRVEDLLAELEEGMVVRVDRMLKDGKADKHGIGIRTASVIMTARREGEILIANLITGFVQTVNGRAWDKETAKLAEENTERVEEILREQIRNAGFEVRRGVYAFPQHLVMYRSTSDWVGWKEGKVVSREAKLT